VRGCGVVTLNRGPVRADERAPTPDLARGIALLGIALANSVLHVHGRRLGPGYRPVDGSTADRAVDLVVGLLVDNRAFPMFTLLFGYGLATLARRQAEAGTPPSTTTVLLLRRSAWLGAFGLVHLLLLFDGDILLPYGLLGLALALLLRFRDRTLLLAAAAASVVFVAFSAPDGLADVDPTGGLLPFDEADPLGAFALRLAQGLFLLLGAPLAVLALLTPAVLGVVLARRRVLERPAEHVRLLNWTIAVGFPVSILGGLPMVLATVQVWTPSTPAGLLAGALHAFTGLGGTLGFLALVARAAVALERRRTPAPPAVAAAVGAFTAVGRRSLTCYLFQSVLLVPLMAPWAGGVGVGAGTAFVAAVAVGVYLASVALAVALERAGRRGPAEVLLRRLTYGTRGRASDRQQRQDVRGG
jgi:uncharacterized protein